jgi:predicted HicB family RNase H-like nuclease
MKAESRVLDNPPTAIEGQRILQVRLSADLYEWLRTTAFYQRRSMNALVNEALEQYRNRPDGR